MTDKEVQQKLRDSNIFTSGLSPLPFNNTNPDLKELNKSVSDRIEGLIKLKIQEPTTPLAGLILCDAGAGKTHMLSRIFRHVQKFDNNTLFVSIRAFINPESVMQDMLSGLIVDINHKINLDNAQGDSPFDTLIRNFFKKFAANTGNDNLYNKEMNSIFGSLIQKFFSKKNSGINKKIQQYLVEQICKNIHGIDKRFASFLASYILCIIADSESSDEKNDNKAKIIEWLRSGLEQTECDELGLPFRDTETMNNYECEREAANFLSSLGLILEYSETTMIVCFDQLDGMVRYEKSLIHSWGNVLAFLVNNVLGTIPLVFVRPDTWINLLAKNLDEAVLQRIEGNKMKMFGCSLDEAKALIRLKLEDYFPKDEANVIYNALIKRVIGKLKNGYSPRRVIETVNDEIYGIWLTPAEIIKKTFDDKFKEKYNEIGALADLYPPEAKEIFRSISLWLSVQENLNITESKDLKIFGYYKQIREFTCIITASKFAPHIIKLVDKGIQFMQEQINGISEKRCCFISEKQIIKTSYKTTNDKLQELAKSGGLIILLDKETRIPVYALANLIKEIETGSVILRFATGDKVASLEDLKLYLKDFKFPYIDKILSYINTPSEITITSSFNEEDVNKILLELLNASPMKIIASKFAIEKLYNEKIAISGNQLIKFLKLSKRFYVVESKNDFQIGLK